MGMQPPEEMRVLAARTRDFLDTYPACWQRVLAAWQASAPGMRMWLLYAASYLFATQGVRWSVDPIVPSTLLPGLPVDLPVDALGRQAFLLITHAHADHLDYRLLAALRGAPVRFVVPEFLRDTVQERVHPAPGQLLTAHPGERLVFDGIQVWPFMGWHWQDGPGQPVGIDALGYLVQAGEQRWLFPGDVRSYNPEHLRPFAPVDILFAHLWLGRARALDLVPPLRDAFCEFAIGCKPRTIVLAHLNEFSRSPEDLWHARHVALVRERLHILAPEIPLRVPTVGKEVVL